MCQANNKRIDKYFAFSKTAPYLKALKDIHNNRSPLAGDRLIIVIKGGNDKDTQGTWVHFDIKLGELDIWSPSDFSSTTGKPHEYLLI